MRVTIHNHLRRPARDENVFEHALPREQEERNRAAAYAKHGISQDATKVSQASVHYRSGVTGRYCASCTMFVKPSSCSHVAGPISAMGTCDDFEQKEGDTKFDRLVRAMNK
jgi:hypothetical protein